MTTSNLEKKEYLRSKITADALINGHETEEKIHYKKHGRAFSWVLDFRRVFSDKQFLNYTADLFWENFEEDKNWQIGGLESAALPLITAVVLNSQNASGFFIRKSRKKKSQAKLIEGKLGDGPIVLVDDLINSGSTFVKQIKALEAEGLSVEAIFAIVKFKDDSAYDYFKEKGIKIYHLFDLSEFDTPKSEIPKETTKFQMDWYFGPKNFHKFVQGARCLPAIDKDFLYLGTDDGKIRKIDKQTGRPVTTRNLKTFTKDVWISSFTNPIVGQNHLMIGTPSGSLLLCAKEDLKVKQQHSVADAITSPLFSFDSSSLMLGVQNNSRLFPYHLLKFDLEKQAVAWQTHVKGAVVSVIFHEKSRNYLFGTTSGHLYCLDEAGSIIWSEQHPDRFLTAGVILEDSEERVLFLGDSGNAYLLKKDTGQLLEQFYVEHFVQSNPLLVGSKLYVGSLERELMCFDLDKKEIEWSYALDGRSFSSPQHKDGYIYLGDNSGTFHKIDAKTGYRDGHFVVPERIVNQPQFIDDKIIISTAANEIYCLHAEARASE